MEIEPDEVETVDDAEIASLDTALNEKTQEEKDAEAQKLKDGGEVDTPEEDLHPGEEEDEAEPNQPNNISPEEKRERNRKYRAEQKRLRRERIEANKRELAAVRAENAQLANRLATIENRSTSAEVAQLDARIAEAARHYHWYKGQIAEQSAASNHVGVAEATDKMLQAQRAHDQLLNAKNGFVQNQRRGAQPAPDPRLVALGNKWMADNQWYNPASGDEDSERVLLEDRLLVKRGFSPSTPEYWDELTKQVNKNLPHRAKGGSVQANAERPRAPVAGGGTNGGGSGVGTQGMKLSADRVAAMKAAGQWDDPVKKKATIAAYRKWDADHAT